MGAWICAANERRTVKVNLSIGRGGVFREDSIKKRAAKQRLLHLPVT